MAASPVTETIGAQHIHDIGWLSNFESQSLKAAALSDKTALPCTCGMILRAGMRRRWAKTVGADGRRSFAFARG